MDERQERIDAIDRAVFGASRERLFADMEEESVESLREQEERREAERQARIDAINGAGGGPPSWL